MFSKRASIKDVKDAIRAGGATGAVGRISGSTVVITEGGNKDGCFGALRAAGFALEDLGAGGPDHVHGVIVTKAR